MPKDTRKAFLYFCFFLAICMLVWWGVAGTFVRNSSKETYYVERAETDEVLPSFDELPEHESLRTWYCYHRLTILFESRAYSLCVEYDDSTYQQEKSRLLKDLNLHQEQIPNYNHGFFAPSFSLGPYEFHILAGYDFPKDIYFIGFSDSTNEIAYVGYFDFDLDYIDCSLPEFLMEDCGWAGLYPKLKEQIYE